MPQLNNEHLRIAMLGHKRVPSREGGVEIVVEQLAVRLFSMGHSVTCYNRRSKGAGSNNKKAKKNYKGVRLKSVWTVDKRGLAAMTSSFSGAIEAAFGRYDVVHFHAEGPCAMMWIPKLFGKKCIATIHGLDHKRAKWGKFASKYILFGEKCAVKFADEIIVLSESVRDYFMTTYGRKTTVIPNGVERPEIIKAEEITEKFGLKGEDYILYLGRLVPEKGIAYLIEAFKQIDTDKKLVIAGGSSDAKEFEKELRITAQSDERIIFTDFVEGRVLAELYSNAYIYVLPSDLEGMPLSLLEAMSYGRCCLTSDIPECTSVTEDKGVTFKKGDIQDLKDKLKSLCDSPVTVQKLSLDSADYICSKYNWDEVAEETLKLYRESN